MEDKKELLLNADIAFENKQYEESLKWFERVLELDPEDLYALSRAGSICVPLGKLKEALDFFKRAIDIDPNNGDNMFNYANACFFNKNYVKAFEMYVETERIGCSENILPRLYYQMALMCSLRSDIKSSLLYFKKCEDADKTGMIAVNQDIISEKLKLYMMDNDYENAEKCAAQLVAVNPGVYSNYMVYYSILMSHKKFDEAGRILDDTGKYARMSSMEKNNLVMQKASLCVARGEENREKLNEHYEKAISILKEEYKNPDLNQSQKVDVLMSLSEILQKVGKHAEAIRCLNKTLNIRETPEERESFIGNLNLELSDYEIEEMLQSDLEKMDELISTGLVDDNMGYSADVEYDEYGYPIKLYNDDFFSIFSTNSDDKEETEDDEFFDINNQQRERIYFLLLTSFLEIENFKASLVYAEHLKHSDNPYFVYYGTYVSAVANRKLHGDNAETDRQYAQAIAFFKKRSLEKHDDSLATVFRARLYAEEGKVAKATEIANLLADDDRETLIKYIESCKR